MKKQIITAFIVCIATYGCKNEKTEEPVVEKVELDSIEKKVSYVLGFDSARRMQHEGFTLDSQVIALAVDEFNSGTESRMTEDEMRAAMTAFQTQMREKRQERITKESDGNLKQGQEFLAENAKREGVVVLDSGLQYEVLAEGSGDSPSAADVVSVNYKGSFISGELFDSGEGVSFQVGQLIPGWVEALPLMKTGAKWKLFIPSDLAYGPGGTGNIGPNTTLIFEMELLAIGDGE